MLNRIFGTHRFLFKLGHRAARLWFPGNLPSAIVYAVPEFIRGMSD